MARLLTLLLAALFRALCAHGLDSALEPYALARAPHVASWLVVLATLLVSVALVEAVVFIIERLFRR